MSLIARINNQSSFIGMKGCSRLPVAADHVGVLSAGIHTTSTSHQVTVPTTRILNVPRPLTPFMLFTKENMSKAKHENPKAKLAVVMKTLGQRWATAPKQTYSAKCQTLKKEHEQKVAHANALRKKLAPLMHKPAGSYALFVKEKTKTVQGKGMEKLKNVATQWNKLSAEQKNKYINEAKNQGKLFSEKLGKLSTEESSALKELTFERRVNRLKRIGRSIRRKTLHQLAAKHQRPKRPMVGFIGFFIQNWATLPKGTLVQKAKAADSKWKALPAGERQKLVDSGKAKMAQYKKDMTAWESKMTATGHTDVVRQFHSLKWQPYLPEGVRVVPLKKRPSAEVRMKRLEKKRAAKAKKMQLKRERRQKMMQLRKKAAVAKKLGMLKLKKQATLKKQMQAKKAKALKLKKPVMKKAKLAKAGKKSMAKKVLHKKSAKKATLKKH